MKYIVSIIIVFVVLVGVYLFKDKVNLSNDSVDVSTGSIVSEYMEKNEEKFVKEGLAGNNEALFEVVQWGIKTEESKKVEYLNLLVERNYPPAIRFLAMSYESGSKKVLGKDCIKAEKLVQRLKNNFPDYYNDLDYGSYGCRSN